ncbi:MAG: ABC transporter ATP-binding protein [Alphaproteobacteria bacterium]
MQVAGLRKSFTTPRGVVRAVDGVSFDIGPGETVALVGESGCGKSTVAMSLIRLLEPDSGTVIFDGMDFSDADSTAINRLRQRIGFVFQNPYSSLNPKMRVVDIVGEPLRTAAGLRGAALTERVAEYLRDVGLGPEHLKRYPHEFSGGQRQRIAIARALALEPKLMILDEPTAALDVSVQAQILNLLGEIQRRRHVSYLFISHDLAVVEHIADKVLVMYLGRIVEAGAADQVMAAPRHPYTRALLDSVPIPDPTQRDRLIVLSGEVPSPLNPPPGCPFAPRCNRALDQCTSVLPELIADDGGRLSACHNPINSI